MWLISFGDLLTLLVCFFLVLTPWGSTHGRSFQGQQAVTAAPSIDQDNGISFANRSVGLSTSRGRVVVEREYPLTEVVVGDTQRNKLRDTLVLVARDARELQAMSSRVVLEVCDRADRERVLRIVGAGLSETLGAQFELEVDIEPECRSIGNSPSQTDGLLGSIKLVHE